MAKFLVTWELGSGLGHLSGLKPIVAELIRRGHDVSLALRYLTHANKVFAGLDVTYWQAPFWLSNSAAEQQPPATFGGLLGNVGFGDFGQLATYVNAWRSLLRAATPDVVLYEHSPIALLASREFQFRRVVIGTGFGCPPTEPDLPDLRTATSSDGHGESLALQNARRVLESAGVPPIGTLADLYRGVDDTMLCTFAELDHFGPRPAARYWGFWTDGFGSPFKWPPGSGKRIFVYLKPFSALPALLQSLATWRFPTVVYVDRLDPKLETRFSTANLHFYHEPLDMRQAAAECDLAILNAGHGSLASMLLAGKPVFLLPIFWEQLLQARRARQLGFGEFADPSDEKAVVSQLRKMFASTDYVGAAQGFATKYVDFDPAAAVDELASRLELLAT
jgi:hypothetical protein